MPLPEGYLPRKGDIVVLHAVVKHDVDRSDSLVFLNIVGDYSQISVAAEKIEQLWSRHWDAGDAIQLISRDLAGRRPGEVMSVDGEMVWIKFADQGERFMTFHANQIEPRVPEEDLKKADDLMPAEPPAFDVAGADVLMKPPLTGKMETMPWQMLTLKEKPDVES
jgi:uncharacterized protein YoaH (UPF0181 family)